MQLEGKTPTVNLQDQIRWVCFSVALTILLISTLYMAYNQYVMKVNFIGLSNNTIFLVVAASNICLIMIIYLLSNHQNNLRKAMLNSHMILEHNQKLLLNKKEIRYFTWDIKKKKIFMANKCFPLSETTSMSPISFEEFISRVQGQDINFYQLANNAIQGKIQQIELSFK